jgi:hypothetical protein
VYLTSLLAEFGKNTTLLYRGSRDGWNASDFHRLCDNQGPTVILYLTDLNRVCGSFTTVSWQSDDQPNSKRFDLDAFLFSLDKKLKFKVKNPEDAIYCNRDWGPTFGN